MAMRRKLPKQEETAVLTQSGRRCCVCFGLFGDTKVKEGQIAHLDRDCSHNTLENLAWLCLFHHAQFDARSNIMKAFTLEEVKTHRSRLYTAIEKGALGENEPPARAIKPGPTFTNITGDGSTVINAAGDVKYTIRNRRRAVSIAPPSDAIGANIEMRSYMEYLTKRYIEWRQMAIKRGIDRRPFFPGTMNKLIEKKFGSRVNLVPQIRFCEVVTFVQKAIDNTIWGKKSPHRNYHSFEVNCAQIRGTSKCSSQSP